MLRSSKSQMEEQAKEMESRIQLGKNEEQRSIMQADFKQFRDSITQQAERETQLSELQTKLAAQLQAEQSKLEEMNNQLDSLQREMESQQLAGNWIYC